MEELRKIPVFKDLSDEVLGVILPIIDKESHEAGSVIFEEGSLSDKFYIIAEGEVEIRKKTDRDEYKLIAILSIGEFFGEMAVFLGQPRTAEARAKTDVSLFTLSKDNVSGLFGRSPEGAFKIMEILNLVLMDRLRNTTRELVTVYETGRLISAAHSVQELSDKVKAGILGAIETAEVALFVIWNEFNQEFEVRDQSGYDAPVDVFPADDALIAWFRENREPFLSFNLKDDHRLPYTDGSLYAGGSMTAAPFFSNDRLTGFILVVNRTRHGAFSYNHMVLLSAVSGYVTVALDNLGFIQEAVDRSRLEQARSSIKF